MPRGRVASAAAADAARAVRGGELDAVDAAADAVDVVERVRERGAVRVKWEMDVADDEGGVVVVSVRARVCPGRAGVVGGGGVGRHVGVDVHNPRKTAGKEACAGVRGGGYLSTNFSRRPRGES